MKFDCAVLLLVIFPAVFNENVDDLRIVREDRTIDDEEMKEIEELRTIIEVNEHAEVSALSKCCKIGISLRRCSIACENVSKNWLKYKAEHASNWPILGEKARCRKLEMYV